MEHTTIAIIGYGRFGQCIVDILLEHSSVSIIVVSNKEHVSTAPRLKFSTLSEISQADIVIPVVPISNLEEVVQKIQPYMNPNALCIDVCSVKMYPVDVLKKYLPPTTEIIATHPMFGPDSVKKNNGIHGLTIVLYPARCGNERYQRVRSFCKRIGLRVVEMTPEEHDRQAAYSQAYSFLIGKIGQRMDLQTTAIDTVAYTLLREHAEIVGHDSDQLFVDIQTKNPFAKEMREKVRSQLQEIESEL